MLDADSKVTKSSDKNCLYNAITSQLSLEKREELGIHSGQELRGLVRQSIVQDPSSADQLFTAANTLQQRLTGALYVGGSGSTASSNTIPSSSSATDKEGKESSEPKDGGIKFGPSADASVISDYSRDILKEVGTNSGNDLIYITSTARGPAEQARAMFNNLERDLAQQRRVYRAPGQAVIDVYVTMKAKGISSSEIQAAMTNKINELGPSTVSRHAANPSILNVIDISIRRLAHPEEFRRAIETYPGIRLLNENDVFHIEISQFPKTDKR